MILGLDPVNSSLLPDGSVLVSSTERHRKAIAEEGAFHSGLGCFIPSEVYSHSLRHWGNPGVLTPQGISLPLGKLLSEDQLWSTYIPYQVSQPSGLLLQTSCSLPLWRAYRPPAGCGGVFRYSHFISSEVWGGEGPLASF